MPAPNDEMAKYVRCFLLVDLPSPISACEPSAWYELSQQSSTSQSSMADFKDFCFLLGISKFKELERTEVCCWANFFQCPSPSDLLIITFLASPS